MKEWEEKILLPDQGRRQKILSVSKSEQPSNEFLDNLLLYGKWSYFIANLAFAALFGILLHSPKLLLLAWLILTLFAAALVSCAYFSFVNGKISPWHVFFDESLTLGADSVIFTVKRMRFANRQTEEYKWVMPYNKITRLEYVSEYRRLRVYGSYDETQCKKPRVASLPKDMQPVATAENNALSQPRSIREAALEIPMYYDSPRQVLSDIQERSEQYIRPALREHTLMDLEDLLGIKKQPMFFRPMIVSFALSVILFAYSFVYYTNYNAANPYSPLPETEIAFLSRAFSSGETVILDGCHIKVSKVEKRDKQLIVSVSMDNKNDIPIYFSWNDTNFQASAVNAAGEIVETTIQPPAESLVKIDSGGIYFAECAITSAEQKAASFILRFNSDNWVQSTGFIKKTYVGEAVEIEIDGQPHTVKSNEVSYIIQ